MFAPLLFLNDVSSVRLSPFDRLSLRVFCSFAPADLHFSPFRDPIDRRTRSKFLHVDQVLQVNDAKERKEDDQSIDNETKLDIIRKRQ